MSLWGNKKSVDITGTVTVEENSVTVTGANTIFTEELSIGDFVVFEFSESDIQKYQVTNVQSDTVFMIKSPYVDANTADFTITMQELPKYLSRVDANKTNLVSIEESRLEGNNNGTVTPGWNSVVSYTSADGISRNRTEVLAVVRISDL